MSCDVFFSSKLFSQFESRKNSQSITEFSRWPHEIPLVENFLWDSKEPSKSCEQRLRQLLCGAFVMAGESFPARLPNTFCLPSVIPSMGLSSLHSSETIHASGLWMIMKHTTFVFEARRGQRTGNHYLLLRRNNIREKHHVDAKLKDLP